jgi:hypothetical protein
LFSSRWNKQEEGTMELIDFSKVMGILALGLLVVGGTWVLVLLGLAALRGFQSPRLNRDSTPVPHTHPSVPRGDPHPAPPPDRNP